MRMSISAVVIAAICCAAAQPAGAVVVTSSLYLTAGDQQNGWIVQGSGVVGSWKATNQYEYPIAVNTTVRTLGIGSGFGLGHEYTLAGTPTGPSYAFPIPGNAYDGTTDGIHNYLVRFSGGTVYQTDAAWSSAVPLFSLGDTRLGITYDPLDNSLWLSSWGSNTIENRALDGTLLSSFSIVTNTPAALALDHADETLWFYDRSTLGSTPIFYQYSKAGSLLGSLAIPALAGQNILGGEFAYVEPPVTTPEPASVVVWSLLGLSLAGTHLWRRRRKRRWAW